MASMGFDAGLLDDFIAESMELLEEYTVSLTAFEENSKDESLINPIFRAAHTLKGSSAFFGLDHIKDFAHILENLLDEIRHKERELDSDIFQYLFLGGKYLKDMFTRLSSGNTSTELLPLEISFLKELSGYVAGSSDDEYKKACLDVKKLLNLVLEGEIDSDILIEDLAKIIERLPKNDESSGAEVDILEKTPQEVSYQGYDLTEPIINALKLFDEVEKDGKIFEASRYAEMIEQLKEIVKSNDWEDLENSLKTLTEDFQVVFESGLDFDTIILGLLKSNLDDFCKNLEFVYSPKIKEADILIAERIPKKQVSFPPSNEDRKERKTMRIDEEKVDGFMNYVGELIVTAETFNYLEKMIENERVNPNTVRAFKSANQAFRELSDELQFSLMEIRRVPLKGVLQKVNMMARELSHQLGKKIRVQLEGQDIQIDKSIAESLEGPLIHVVRNSLDHGLEEPDIREGKGKTSEGLLRVAATADKEFFTLLVEDDGKGIDPQIMRQTAVNKGQLSENQAKHLSDQEALTLIFGAGFSTAQKVTDVSGRGVGMDVVRTNIQALNGSISVESQLDKGTTISLKIPLSVTLQVIKALHVRVGMESFIISLEDIVESLRPGKEELATIEGRGLVLNRRGEITPLIKLSEIFGIPADYENLTDGLIVLLDTFMGRYALYVDEVMGQQQVVVKELVSQFKQLDFLSGSALLGDGALGLVLDANGLVKLALNQS